MLAVPFIFGRVGASPRRSAADSARLWTCGQYSVDYSVDSSSICCCGEHRQDGPAEIHCDQCQETFCKGPCCYAMLVAKTVLSVHTGKETQRRRAILPVLGSSGIPAIPARHGPPEPMEGARNETAGLLPRLRLYL